MPSIYDLKPAFQNLLRPLTRRLAAAGVSANHITVAAMMLSGVGGGLIAWQPHEQSLLLLFLRNRVLAWFALNIMHIIPLEREVIDRHQDPLAECSDALKNGDILILFPEGSRGDPEQMGIFKNGIAHLAKRNPEVPVVPIFLHGLGKALPKGEAILVPFFCDVFIGESISWNGDRTSFMTSLEQGIKTLAEEGYRPAWE